MQPNIDAAFMLNNKSHIVTITSDWGINNPDLAVVKGRFLALCPQIQIVDIAHNIPCFNINPAAFVVRNSFFHFPKGTWHIVAVDNNISNDTVQLIVKYDEHYFIGCDNGFFNLICDKAPEEIYQIIIPDYLSSTLFPARDIYVPVIAHILNGGSITDMAQPYDILQAKSSFSAILNPNGIVGKVVYIDAYENLYTNIHQCLFTQEQLIEPFTLSFKNGTHPKTHIFPSFLSNRKYNPGALFINDHLVVFMNSKNAAGLLGVKLDDPVRIIFEN